MYTCSQQCILELWKITITIATTIYHCIHFSFIKVSGNLSLYPGEGASFICSINTSTSADVVFHWTRFFNGTNTTVTLPEDNEYIGSASGVTHRSMFNLTDVNYTNNDNGFQCNVSGNASDIAYLTGSYLHHQYMSMQ